MKTYKRVIVCMLALCFTFLVACTNGTEGAVESKFDKIKLWGAYNTESIMADEPARSAAPDLDLACIKGETESGQFIMTSYHENTIAAYTVVASELKLEGGSAVIPSSAIELYNQKYIKVKNSSFPKKSNHTAPMYTGYYPDALIPMASAVAKRENRLSTEFNQGIWVNVNVPIDAVAGIYTGKITIKIGKEAKNVNVKLKVFDVSASDSVHAQSLFAIWYNLIEKGEEKTSSKELEEKYYWYLADKNINPTAVPTSGYKNYDEFADYIVTFAKDKRITKYQLPVIIDTQGEYMVANKDDAKKMLVALSEKQNELKAAGDTTTNLFSKAFWYTIDEPDYTDHMSSVPLNEKALTQAKNEVAALYPDYAASIQKIASFMVTQYLHPDYAGSDADGGIQTWCPQIHRFDSDLKYTVNGEENKSITDFINWRKSNPDNKAAGEDIWWYNCNVPENPYPNYMLDDNLIASRLMTWMQYNLGVSGSLSWSVNYFQKLSGAGLVERNLWEDPVTMGRTNGDGYLLYPGSSYGIDGPIGTVRLESIREGKEDYEYFWLLETRLAELNAKHSKNYDARTIQSKYLNKLVKNNIIAIIDGGKENNTFVQNRLELLTLLENILKDDATALATLDSLR